MKQLRIPVLPSRLHNLGQAELQPDRKAMREEMSSSDLSVYFPISKELPPLTVQQSSAKREPFSGGPLRVGVLFSGGPAPGGHNVLWGLQTALASLHPESKLVGFKEGVHGFLKEETILLDERLSPYANTGGFDCLGTSRDKLSSSEDLALGAQVARNQKLNGLVIIGGDDSNTNAAHLAEYFFQRRVPTSVVGIPKTIDGDLQGGGIELPFGFDTACTCYSDLIENLMRDTLSTRKYYHFVQLMGRSTSHVNLECALRKHPNFTLISEEITEHKLSLETIVQNISETIKQRKMRGIDFGICLIPEGWIEAIPEVKQLLDEIASSHIEGHSSLSTLSQTVLNALPDEDQHLLLHERDDHGNIPLSRMESGKLLLRLVSRSLASQSLNLKAIAHSFGYEGRSAHPTPFDATYCFSLGQLAALLIFHGKNGYLCAMESLTRPTAEWRPRAIPICNLIYMEQRNGLTIPVIKKKLVDLDGIPFQTLRKNRAAWAKENDYVFSPPTNPALGYSQLSVGSLEVPTTLRMCPNRNSG